MERGRGTGTWCVLGWSSSTAVRPADRYPACLLHSPHRHRPSSPPLFFFFFFFFVLCLCDGKVQTQVSNPQKERKEKPRRSVSERSTHQRSSLGACVRVCVSVSVCVWMIVPRLQLSHRAAWRNQLLNGGNVKRHRAAALCPRTVITTRLRW